MDIIIDRIESSEDIAAMLEVWQQVFERELGIMLPQSSNSSHISHWLARLEAGREPVGTLSLVDTTGQHELHNSLGFNFDPAARVARSCAPVQSRHTR